MEVPEFDIKADASGATGATVWNAARVLADVLTEHAAASPMTVLELGSGTGFAGISLAERRPDVQLLLTEMPACGAFDHLAASVREAEASCCDKQSYSDFAQVCFGKFRYIWPLQLNKRCSVSFSGLAVIILRT